MEELKTLIRNSVGQLLEGDRLLFIAPIGNENSEIDRKLHEICINHRLAVYLEANLTMPNLIGYCVDLEYNRNFEVIKKARRNPDEQEITVRPDILIHQRVNRNLENANYLVIEAKKQDISDHDIDKIHRLILDTRFNYKFGLTISYLRNPEFVECVIYWKNEEGSISNEELNINK